MLYLLDKALSKMSDVELKAIMCDIEIPCKQKIEILKEPVKNSELLINAQNYPDGCYEELEKLKKEYQSQYSDIESKYKGFHGRDDRSAKELMDLTVAFRKRIKTIRDKYNV